MFYHTPLVPSNLSKHLGKALLPEVWFPCQPLVSMPTTGFHTNHWFETPTPPNASLVNSTLVLAAQYSVDNIVYVYSTLPLKMFE